MDELIPTTHELDEILGYVKDILRIEFPTNSFSLEYLIAAILSVKKSHANAILDNCLMSNNIEELKKIYFSYLQDNYGKKNNVTLTDSFSYDEETENILNSAIEEKEELNSKKLGSEHVLLAILNPNNENRIQDVLKTVGLDYKFIKSKCFEDNNSKTNTKSLKKNNRVDIGSIIQAKNELNNSLGITSKTQYITQYTTNLNKLVRDGEVDETFGRSVELHQIIKVLARREKNNVILVGKGGVGKTKIVYGLASAIVYNQVPKMLTNKEIILLNVTALVSGTHFRGMFEERVKGLFDELKSNKKYILFIDDIHTVLKGSVKDKDTDLSSMIDDVLNNGEVRVIGTTNFKEYKNTIGNAPSIERKFQKIVIEPSSVEDSIQILMNNKKYYEDYHNVKYGENVIRKCVELSERYITDRSLPDSAFDVLDLSGARTCFEKREPIEISESRDRLAELGKLKAKALGEGDFESIDQITYEENTIKLILSTFEREMEKHKEEYCVDITEDDIAASVAELSGIPVKKMTTDEKSRLSKIDEILKEKVIGQDDAIKEVCRIIKRNKVGLGDKSRCAGACLLIGSSGTGKTLIAKQLAEQIFGDENALIRFDMSEFSEKHSVSKLIGAGPSYVGYGEGGQLTEAVRHKPYCVLLLDEIEKADKEVYNIFLQLFDEGHLTDGSGQIVSFKNVIVLMTSNVGTRKASEMNKGIGFTQDEASSKRNIIEKELKRTFSPEFLNRIDSIVFFNNLSDENLKSIVELELNKFKKRINTLNYDIKWDENVTKFLHSKALKQKEYGARPIIRLIQDNIEDNITDLMLQNDYKNNYTFKISYKDEKVTIE